MQNMLKDLEEIEVEELLDQDIEYPTVDDYLNIVSYVQDTSYIPDSFALGFINFVKLVNGGRGEENTTPVMHYRMLDQIPGKEDIANMVYRGSAKTTLLGEYLFLYLAVYREIPEFGLVNLAMYISDSVENGVKNMRKNLEHRYQNSDFLLHYIPTIKFTELRWEFINLDQEVFIVKAYGAKSGVRGAKELGVRPQLAIMDDLISDEDARSQTVIAAVEDTVYKAVDYALHPTRRKIIWSGTPFNAGDPLYKAIESGAWKVNVFPVCEKFPCSRKEFRGAWEDRHDYDYVAKQYKKAMLSGKIDTFNQELMLRIMSDEERLIKDHDINWFSRVALLKNRGAYNWYITTDFATSEEEANDFSVISVWALNHNGDWFWVDGVVEKQDMGVNIDDLFRLVQVYKPLETGVEISGQQKGFISWIKKEMLTRNIFFNLAKDGNSKKEGLNPNTNKMVRFQVVVPWFKAGKMYFPEELKQDPRMKEFMNELKLATQKKFKSKHDDCIDTVSQLPLLKSWMPSAPAYFEEKKEQENEFDKRIWNVGQKESETGEVSGMDYYT